MPADPDAVTDAYLAHLTSADRALLLETDGGPPDPARLRRPGAIERLLPRRELFDAVLGPGGPGGAPADRGPGGAPADRGPGGAPADRGPGGAPADRAPGGAPADRAPDGGGSGRGRGGDVLVDASPFLVFAVATHRVATDLASATHVLEWLGPGRRAPVFDVAPLQVFLASPWHRLFLAELLGSYTHVASGSVMVSTRRGWRRQRFSELDPVRLAALLEVVPDEDRPGILRRLGDLALFLTGVFPDHLARRGFGPIEEGRLLRAGGMAPARRASSPAWALGDAGAVDLLELLGRRWYRAAFDLLPPPVPAAVAVLGELPEHFTHARRVLNLITDRFLFHYRDQWWPSGG